MNSSTISNDKVLRLPATEAKTGVSRSTIYNKITPHSKYFDKTFPEPIRLGANAIGFLESELDQWIAARAAARNFAKERA